MSMEQNKQYNYIRITIFLYSIQYITNPFNMHAYQTRNEKNYSLIYCTVSSSRLCSKRIMHLQNSHVLVKSTV